MKKILILLILTPLLLAVFLFSRSALAADPCDSDADGSVSTQEAIKCGSGSAAGTSNSDPATVDSLTKRIIKLLSAVVGIAAVIMIVVGGFRYITSGGDSTKVGAAKNTIVYALIGLVIAVLAQVIANFVLHTATK